MTTIPSQMPQQQQLLPSPADRPDADVVIYDGQCRFCTAQVSRLSRWDSQGRLAFVSLHDPLVAERYADLSHEAMMREMYIVDRTGRRHAGAAALRYLSRRLPRLWILAPMLHIPFTLPLWQWAYQQVARRRYQISGANDCENGACAVHFGEKAKSP